MNIRYLSEEEVVALNMYVIQRYSPQEQIGIKSPELLHSAMNRPKQSAFGQDAYPSIIEKAGALFESLAKNHAFFNANKRTAFLSLVQFLRYNGYRFVMPSKMAENFVVDVVIHKYAFVEIVNEIAKYSIPIE